MSIFNTMLANARMAVASSELASFARVDEAFVGCKPFEAKKLEYPPEADQDIFMASLLKGVVVAVENAATEFMLKAYAELGGYNVELPKDPVATGLEKINENFSLAREYSNRVSTLFQRGLRIRGAVSAMMGALDSEKNEACSNILRNDKEIKDAKVSATERMAIAESKCSVYKPALDVWKKLDAELEIFVKIVLHKYGNLRDSRFDISGQADHLKTMMATGELPSKWVNQASGLSSLREGDVDFGSSGSPR